MGCRVYDIQTRVPGLMLWRVFYEKILPGDNVKIIIPTNKNQVLLKLYLFFYVL